MKVRTRKPRKPAPNPLRVDPTRTITLRRAFAAEFARRFNAIRLDVVNLIEVEDAFGLRETTTFNAFCPTGPGGGIDPHCSPGGSRDAAETRKAAQWAVDTDNRIRHREVHSLTRPTGGHWDRPERLQAERDVEEALSAGGREVVKTYWLDSPVQGKGSTKFWVSGSDRLEVSEEAGKVVVERPDSRKGRFEYDPGDPERLDRIRATAGLKRKPVGNAWEFLTVTPVTVAVLNTRWKFRTNPEKVQAFASWLRSRVAERFKGQSDEALFARYVESGFRRGAGRAFDDVRKTATWDDVQRGGRDEFLRSAFGQPETVQKLQLLVGRVLTDLDGVTDDLEARMVRVLADGLVTGSGPREIARALGQVTDLSRGRAETIAHTELARAHNEGMLLAFEDLGVEELGVMVELLVTHDNVLCPLCAALEGVVVKLSEAHGMLPRHPRCRCSWTAAGVGESTKGQKRTKAAIDAAVKRSQKLGSDEWGPAKTIAKKRPESILNAAATPELVAFSRWLASR